MKRIGVIGGGQLAWMMASAATELGLELVIQTPQQTDVAVKLAAETVFAPVDDVPATAILSGKCEVITFENEFVDLDGLAKLAATFNVKFRPPLSALAPLLDKYTQRVYLRDLGLPVPNFAALELPILPVGFEFPVVVKARRNGYDGQGTFVIKDKFALENLVRRYPDTPLIIEEFIDFDRELAVLAARSIDGDIVIYPILETQQQDGICRRVLTIDNLSAEIAETCKAIATELMASLGAIGVFAIELFLTRDGRVSVNEIAPRTHNSGHLTIEACQTSQFSQIVRAVAGLPLDRAELRCGGAVMVNLLGLADTSDDYADKRHQISTLPDAYLHWYGKESRPGRKLGHVTLLIDPERQDPAGGYRDRALALAEKVEAIWYD